MSGNRRRLSLPELRQRLFRGRLQEIVTIKERAATMPVSDYGAIVVESWSASSSGRRDRPRNRRIVAEHGQSSACVQGNISNEAQERPADEADPGTRDTATDGAQQRHRSGHEERDGDCEAYERDGQKRHDHGNQQLC